LKLRVGKGAVKTLARPELHGEKGAPHFGWPTRHPAVPTRAGIQPEEEPPSGGSSARTVMALTADCMIEADGP
jgi:hypothetical protein